MKQNSGIANIRQGVYWNELHPFLHVRSTFASGHPYAVHFHDCLSLGVLFDGGTELRRNGAGSTIHAGQMALIAPMEPHSCNPLGTRKRGYHMLYIDAEWVRTLLGAPRRSDLSVSKRILDDRSLFGGLMRLAEAIREGRSDPPGCDALAEAIKANCAFRPAPPETPGASSAGSSSWADGMDSVEESAQELGMRRETFIRAFRRGAGVTPVRYRQCLRLIRARELLRQGRSLVDTALACGYTDQSHFHRMCVKYLSATPVQITPRKSMPQSLSFKK